MKGPEVDLDAAPAPAVAASRLRAVLLAGLGLAAVVAGACVAVAARPAPPAPPPRVAVSAILGGAVLTPSAGAPVPAAVLRLVLANADAGTWTVDALTVDGGGAVPGEVRVGLRASPGDRGTTDVTVPLRCAARPDADPRGVPALHVRLRKLTTSGPLVVREADVLVAEDAAGRAGLCAAVDPLLPGGWREPVTTSQVSWGAGTVDLTIAGLPADAAAVLAVQADGLALPPAAPFAAPVGGRTALSLRLPQPDCAALGRQRLPVGLQVLVAGAPGTGLRAVYAPVGPELARRLLASVGADCPSGG